MRRGTLCAAVLLGAVTGGTLVKKLWQEKYQRLKMELDSSERERELLYNWLRLKRQGTSLTEYFTVCGYQRIAIFGMGRVGRLIANELGEMAVYGVEANDFSAVHEQLMVYRWGEDSLPPADCMVVCDLIIASEALAEIKETFSGDVVTLIQIFE